VPETENEQPLSFWARFILAWSVFFRILVDPPFAREARAVRHGLPAAPKAPELPAKPVEQPVELEPAKKEPKPAEKPAHKLPEKPELPSTTPALQLLSLLQREGRLVDFLEQDIAGFSDVEVASAVRVVHEGCRKALRGHMKLGPIRAEEEGATVTVPAGYSPAEVKLTGNVQGSAPYKGTLQHRGWRATDVVLPTPVQGFDPSVLAPAEVEL
jgi:hypothetical protein